MTSRLDPHSFADLTQARVSRMELDLHVDFAARALRGEVVLRFAAPARGGTLDLDSRDLAIASITGLDGRPLPFALHAPPAGQEWLGQRLAVELPAGAEGVKIRYAASPHASALQWMEASQTAGGKHPFLYSQCQAIHARSVVPLQDTPLARITFSARLTVPKALRALVAAAWVRREERGAEATETYQMPQPIPPYLFAFAVGDLARHELTPRIAVWAEPAVLPGAAWEFEGIGRMMDAAEKLFGPYDWDRYDVLVMPPGFPYGGMENPRLTFATPSLLAGDRSLVNVIAHELAHAWTGNLVSNASGDHFWLNEGFTVYAERRIVEALDGTERSELQAAIGRIDLVEAIERFHDRPHLSKLRCDLTGVDPDDAYSSVPYEKGYLFLRRLEELAGRPAFDRFLQGYLRRFRFQSITTDEFLDELEKALPGLAARAEAGEWLDQPGLPAGAPQPKAQRLDQLKALAKEIGEGRVPGEEEARQLGPTELQLVLQALPEKTSASTCAELERRFGLKGKKSLELRTVFLEAALRAGLAGAPEQARQVLLETGRMKFLKPLFRALAKRPETLEYARGVYAEAKGRYHPIARGGIEAILAKGG